MISTAFLSRPALSAVVLILTVTATGASSLGETVAEKMILGFEENELSQIGEVSIRSSSPDDFFSMAGQGRSGVEGLVGVRLDEVGCPLRYGICTNNAQDR